MIFHGVLGFSQTPRSWKLVLYVCSSPTSVLVTRGATRKDQPSNWILLSGANRISPCLSFWERPQRQPLRSNPSCLVCRHDLVRFTGLSLGSGRGWHRLWLPLVKNVGTRVRTTYDHSRGLWKLNHSTLKEHKWTVRSASYSKKVHLIFQFSSYHNFFYQKTSTKPHENLV